MSAQNASGGRTVNSADRRSCHFLARDCVEVEHDRRVTLPLLVAEERQLQQGAAREGGHVTTKWSTLSTSAVTSSCQSLASRYTDGISVRARSCRPSKSARSY